MVLPNRRVLGVGVVLMGVVGTIRSAGAASGNLVPKKDWMGDVGLGFAPSGFDALSDGRIVAIRGSELNVYDAAGGFVKKLTEFSEGWGAWVRVDPSEQTVWFGYTTGGNVDDRIYSVPLSADFSQGDQKVHRATLAGNFDAEFALIGGQERLLVAGTNSSDWADPHCIWLLDTSGANEHDKLVQIGGWSVGLAVDLNNRLISSSALTNRLYRFDENDWLSAIGPGWIGLEVGEELTELGGGNNDVTVDDAGNILFNINGARSLLAVIEAGKDYGGYGPTKYDVIAEGDPSLWHWFTNVDAEGDLIGSSTPGRGYTADFWYPDVSFVPEPGALALMAVGWIGVVRRRRRKPGVKVGAATSFV